MQHFLLTVEVKIYNVMISRKNYFEQTSVLGKSEKLQQVKEMITQLVVY